MRSDHFSDRLFYLIVYCITALALTITLYPFIYVLSISISSAHAIDAKRVFLYPVEIDFTSYKALLNSPAIWTAYFNTLWYTVIGTFLNILLTCMAAYPLSRQNFFARRFFNFFFIFTMFFSGGLIPLYVLITKIGLYNSRWVLILPSLIIMTYLIICRTSFEAIPNEIIESASIEGCSDITTLVRIIIPLSKPILAVLVLYYAIGHWNEFFSALIFISDNKLQPLQVVLRRIVIMASPELMQKLATSNPDIQISMSSIQIKYAAIIITIGPILMIYPLIQKYLIRGVMIGAVKG